MSEDAFDIGALVNEEYELRLRKARSLWDTLMKGRTFAVERPRYHLSSALCICCMLQVVTAGSAGVSGGGGAQAGRTSQASRPQAYQSKVGSPTSVGLALPLMMCRHCVGQWSCSTGGGRRSQAQGAGRAERRT